MEDEIEKLRRTGAEIIRFERMEWENSGRSPCPLGERGKSCAMEWDDDSECEQCRGKYGEIFYKKG
jgi:hypothetical protein